MSFGYQLKTLLWKCCLIRRRSWIRTVFEILMPSAIFIIFLIVKAATSNGIKYSSTCYDTDHTMMSVGFLPFAQSTFCKALNGDMCAKSASDFQSINTYNGSILNEIYKEVVTSFGKHSPSQLTPPTTGKADTDTKNEDLLHKNAIRRLLRLIGKASHADTYQVICGNSTVSDSFKFETKMARALEQLGLESQSSEPINTKRITAEECDRVIQIFGNKDMLKPFLFGKILFTPNTKATRKIMQLANEAINPLVKFKDMVDTLANSEVFNKIVQNATDKETVLKDLMSNSGEGMNSASLMDALSQIGGIDFVKDMVKQEDGLLSVPKDQIRNMTDLIETLKWIQKMVKFASKFMGCIDLNRFQAHETERDLEVESLKLRSTNSSSTFLAGVVFLDFPTSNDADLLPTLTRYKIRMDSDKSPNPNKKDVNNEGLQGPSKYMTSGFLYLQDIIERAIIASQTGQKYQELPGVVLQAFPYPCYAKDKSNEILLDFLPLLWPLTFMLTALNVVTFLVKEKESQLKETMKVMGLSNAVFWVSALIDGLIYLSLAILLLTTILKTSGIFFYTNAILVLFVLFSYGMAVISYAFFISTLFQSTIFANMVTAFFFAFSLAFDDIINQRIQSMSSPLVRLLCLSFNTALGFASRGIASAEKKGLGRDWTNISDPVNENNPLTMLDVIIMFWLGVSIWFILAWYIENVYPGSYGNPKPWYFCLTLDYWCPFWKRKKVAIAEAAFNPENSMEIDSDLKVENEPKHLRLGVAVKNLSKAYKKGSLAVENLSINFYEGQITSFLGHNGAGKTTTLNMLLGILPPTAGTAEILGLDLMEDMEQIRKSIGMCPQHNILFDQLTVEEHLLLYGQLRGRGRQEILKESFEMLKLLDLESKRKVLTCTLSGGMKRKLSIATAFTGQSKVVVLDEPSAGVDPLGRRAIWDVLLKYKKDRTIIMSTHFMDEADLLGDRIAIINEGRLVCVGSSIFLREMYSNGYYLTLDLEENDIQMQPEEKLKVDESEKLNTSKNDTDTKSKDEKMPDLRNSRGEAQSTQFSTIVDQASKLVSTHVPGAVMIEQIGSELKFVLPTQYMAKFEPLLTALETKQQNLGIRSYGVSDTTLEEIFLKVASPVNEQRMSKSDMSNEDIRRTPSEESSGAEANRHPPAAMKSKKPVWLKHFLALTVKKFLYLKRNPLRFLSDYIAPIIMIIVGFKITETTYFIPTNMPVEIQPWLYIPNGQPDQLYSVVSKGSDRAKWPDRYISELLSKNGMGTKCIQRSTHEDKHCSGKPAKPFSNDNMERVLRQSLLQQKERTKDYSTNAPHGCQCNRQGMSCDSNPNPSITQLASYDYLSDLSGQSMSHYLVKNRKDKKKRRGGFEFGIGNILARINVNKLTQTTTAILKKHQMSSIEKVANEFLTDAILSSPGDNVRVWFVDTAFGMEAAYLNSANNAILRATIRATMEDQQNLRIGRPIFQDLNTYGIALSVQHINNTAEQNYQNYQQMVKMYNFSSLFFAWFFVYLLILTISSSATALIEEKVSKLKHLQYQSGVKPITYWVSAFVWDFSVFCLAIPIIVVGLSLMGERSLTDLTVLPVFITSLSAFWFSGTPLAYLASWFFTLPERGSQYLAFINIFLTTGPYVLVLISEARGDEGTSQIWDTAFIFIPHYCLIHILWTLNMASPNSAHSTGLDGIWDFDVTGKYILSMFVCGAVFLLIVANLEYHWFAILKKTLYGSGGPRESKPKVIRILLGLLSEYKIFCTSQVQYGTGIEEGSIQDDVYEGDVRVEQNRIENLEKAGNIIQPLMVTRLTKFYDQKRPVVNNLTFGVENGECFGLLGVNGAGKTTTFKMLTGDEAPSSGDAFINGHSILTSLNNARKNVGYCPQFDALFGYLTAKEHLTFYSRIKGLDENSTQTFVNWCVTRLGLLPYADQLSMTYSGGNKRKLSTAISFVGNPAIIFLDEPTAGMDAGARRFLWNCITDVIKDNRSVILTTHSMEECEALCSRLVIMVNGKFMCHGSAQHLKNLYGSGYSLTVRAKNTSLLDEVRELVNSQFPNNELKEEHSNQLLFQLPLANGILPKVFKVLQEAKLDPSNSLEDFSISQLTLDDVFLHFAKNQDR